MFCINCGTKLPDNARFCSSCGTQVGKGLPPLDEPREERHADSQNHQEDDILTRGLARLIGEEISKAEAVSGIPGFGRWVQGLVDAAKGESGEEVTWPKVTQAKEAMQTLRQLAPTNGWAKRKLEELNWYFVISKALDYFKMRWNVQGRRKMNTQAFLEDWQDLVGHATLKWALLKSMDEATMEKIFENYSPLVRWFGESLIHEAVIALRCSGVKQNKYEIEHTNITFLGILGSMERVKEVIRNVDAEMAARGI